MLIFPCPGCGTSLSAEPHQAGMRVLCRQCGITLRVPGSLNVSGRKPSDAAAVSATAPNPAGETFNSPSSIATASARRPVASTPARAVSAPKPQFKPSTRAGGKRYGFNCAYCSSRLEATEAMAAQEGQCPTCGNTITIPILDRYGRLVDPVTNTIIKQDPHPVHAYAAAGERAPRIIRESGMTQTIQCPRCQAKSPITANNCKSCGMPFTMEGTTVDATGATNSFCIASLVIGIIAVPTAVVLITPALAVIFGVIGYRQTREAGESARGGGLAIAGMALGALGLFIAFYWKFMT